jgi:hypothetical protein
MILQRSNSELPPYQAHPHAATNDALAGKLAVPVMKAERLLSVQ